MEERFSALEEAIGVGGGMELEHLSLGRKLLRMRNISYRRERRTQLVSGDYGEGGRGELIGNIRRIRCRNLWVAGVDNDPGTEVSQRVKGEEDSTNRRRGLISAWKDKMNTGRTVIVTHAVVKVPARLERSEDMGVSASEKEGKGMDLDLFLTQRAGTGKKSRKTEITRRGHTKRGGKLREKVSNKMNYEEEKTKVRKRPTGGKLSTKSRKGGNKKSRKTHTHTTQRPGGEEEEKEKRKRRTLRGKKSRKKSRKPKPNLHNREHTMPKSQRNHTKNKKKEKKRGGEGKKEKKKRGKKNKKREEKRRRRKEE
ncbi:hypothetical protein DENSPDRAFT_852955 [Dentipellis sp. KUC8613]|nr:hypothetical protein DENSPDRAFT_852955 [Dentipellis sp. KUC8613]